MMSSKTNTNRIGTAGFAAAALLAAATLTGCGLGSGPVDGPIAGARVSGKLYGGQQPVVGATIQLYAAGNGYGAAATPLVGSTIKTGADGSFVINVAYTCPTASTPMYITATGGNAGYGSNPNLALMSALGACGTSGSRTVWIDEVTTVASVWALAPFMSSLTAFGAPSTNAAGLAAAFADVNTLVDTTRGTSPGPGLAVGTSVPSSEIYALANVLAACVNTTGGNATDTSTTCGKLFHYSDPGTGAPADTVTAALDIARNPGHNVTNIFNLASTTPPFQPSLATPPDNFTIAVKFGGGVVNNPTAVAVDSLGNIWIPNAGNNTVTELAANGAVISTGYTASLNTPTAIAIDSAGGAWITNKGNNTVSRLTSSGGVMPGSPYSGGGLNLPASIAFDNAGNAWIGNAGNASTTELSSTGSAVSPPSGYSGSGVSTPIGIAVSSH